MMVISNKYEIGQGVFLKTDAEQLMRIVLHLKVFKNDIIYTLACGKEVSEHYDFEITAKKKIKNEKPVK